MSRRRNHGTTHIAPCSMHPPRRARVRIEHAVEHHGGEELLGDLADRHVVLAADVLATSEEVGGGTAVVVEGLLEGATATTDVDHEGHVALLQGRPEAVVVGVRRRLAAAGVGRHEDRARQPRSSASSSATCAESGSVHSTWPTAHQPSGRRRRTPPWRGCARAARRRRAQRLHRRTGWWRRWRRRAGCRSRADRARGCARPDRTRRAHASPSW